MSSKTFRALLADNDLTVGPMKDFNYQIQFARAKKNRFGHTTWSTINAYTNDRELAEAIVKEYTNLCGKTRGEYVRVGYRRPGTKMFGDRNFARVKG